AAHAAWNGRLEVMREDIRAAARLALPHRRRRNPFDAPGIDEDLLDQILNDDEPDPPVETPSGTDSPADAQSDDGQDASDPGDRSPGEREPGDQQQYGAGQASAPDSTRDAESGDGETEAGSPQKPSEQQAGSHETGSTDTSVVQSLDPYRARVFTVRGTGMG